MEVGEQRVVGLEPPDLGGLRLLDLDDQRRLLEHGVRVGKDRRPPGPRTPSSVIAEPSPAPALHEHLVPGIYQLANAGRRQRDPVLIRLDLCWNPDPHA